MQPSPLSTPRPLADWPVSARAGVLGVMTDIDDTLTRDGAIEPVALQALHKTYGQDVVASGPTLREVQIDGATARVRFNDIGGGLAASDGQALRGFALAGADRVFRWATSAVIDGDAVVLQADGVEQPVAVRYGWDINPDVNLVNAEGLPAATFRSDGWPMATGGRR